MSNPDYFTPAEVAALVLPSDRYTVVAIGQTSEVGGESLYDVLDISFTVTGRSGVFSVQFPLTSFRTFESGIDLSGPARIVEDIYRIAV